MHRPGCYRIRTINGGRRHNSAQIEKRHLPRPSPPQAQNSLEKKEGQEKITKRNRATFQNLSHDHLRKTRVSDVVKHGPTNPPKVTTVE